LTAAWSIAAGDSESLPARIIAINFWSRRSWLDLGTVGSGKEAVTA